MTKAAEVLVRVKYFEPAKSEGIENPSLEGLFDHPDRYRYCVCRLKDNKIGLLGGAGSFPVIDGRCVDFLGNYPAEIVEYLDETHFDDSDYFELANENTL
jgi:hypothetical protein